MPSNCLLTMRTAIASVVVLLAAVAASATLLPAQGSGDDDQVLKVVYHADFADPRRCSAMLTSIHNMAQTYENDLVDYDIRIVFVAHGIRFITDDNLEGTPFAADAKFLERREYLRGRLRSLHTTKGVKFKLCDITRTQINKPEGKFYTMVKFVRSGVVRIAELQRKGFAYLKVEQADALERGAKRRFAGISGH